VCHLISTVPQVHVPLVIWGICSCNYSHIV
jgi:hypothetical protein